MSTSYHHGDLRRALITAGRDHLRRAPASSMSVRDAARALGVSHAAPYKHFPDRAAYLAAVAAACLAESVAAEKGAAEDAGGARERLVAAGYAYVEWAVAHPHAFALAYDPEVNRHGDPGPELAATVDEHNRWFQGLVLAAVNEGILRATEPVERHAAFLWSLAHGLAGLVTAGRLPLSAVASILEAALPPPAGAM